MKQWSQYLITHPPPKSDTLKEWINEVQPDIILNTRERTETSHWYEEAVRKFAELAEDPDKKKCWELKKLEYSPENSKLDFEFINLPIPQGSVYKDEGKQFKDKDITVKKLVRRLVGAMKEHRKVLIICTEDLGYLCRMILWWYRAEKEKKVADIIREAKDGGDFSTGKTKEQRAQMEAIREYAMGIERWEGFCQKAGF